MLAMRSVMIILCFAAQLLPRRGPGIVPPHVTQPKRGALEVTRNASQGALTFESRNERGLWTCIICKQCASLPCFAVLDSSAELHAGCGRTGWIPGESGGIK